MMRKRLAAIVLMVALTLLLGTSLVAQAGPAWARSAKPKISSFKASTKAVKTGNGTVTLTAKKVSNATRCVLTSNPLLAGLPMDVEPCSSIDQVVELPPDHSSGTPVQYTFTLTAQGLSSSATKSVKVKVEPQEGGFVYPSVITGTESGSTGTDGETEYYPFNLTFEFDRVGTCVGTDDCAYNETSISGTGGEYDPYPGTCEQTFSVDQSGDSLAGLVAEFNPDPNEIAHLSFEAQTEYYFSPSPPCENALDWGLDHSYGDGYVNNDIWIPGSTSLSVTYDDGVTTGTIDFTFSYT